MSGGTLTSVGLDHKPLRMRKSLLPDWRGIGLLAFVAALASACSDDDTATQPPVLSIDSFTASATTIDSGSTVDLSWATRGADRITLVTDDGTTIIDSNDATGTVTSPALDQTTIFTLTAFGASGQTSQDLTVTVSAVVGGPTIVEFSANPTSITAGDTVTLTWSTLDAVSVDVSTEGGTPIVMMGGATGTVQVNPVADETYVLVAVDAEGRTATSSLMVTVVVAPQAPTVVQFQANPDTLDSGQSTTLQWQVTGTGPMTIVITDDGGTEIVSSGDLTGSQMVTPGETTTYTLVATNVAGMDTATDTVTVNPLMGARIISFEATPSEIAPGETSVLSWSTELADRVLVEGDGVTISDSAMASGSAMVMPSVTTTYSLTAFNANGDATGAETVTVTPIQPVVASFGASPNLVVAGSTTTLSWSVMMAQQVLIRRGATVLTTTSSNTGTLQVDVLAGVNTFTLEATNPGASAIETVDVRGLEAPAINAFTVTPAQSPTTVTTTIAWDVFDVSELTLTANGMAVASFPVVSTSTVVNAQGSLLVTVAENTDFELTARNPAGVTMSTQTIRIEVLEAEPNDDFISAQFVNLRPNGTAVVIGDIPVGNDEDWFVVSVPTAGSSIRLETSDGMGGCNFDTVVSLFDQDGTTQLARNDDKAGSADRCSLIDPMNLTGASNLPAGTYFVRVESFDTNTGAYHLDIRVLLPMCGNGIVEAVEQCDDRNTISMDGCSASCQFEAENSYTGPSMATTFMDPIDPVNDIDVVQLTITATSYLAAETFTSQANRDCTSADTLLTLYDVTGQTVIGEDDADGIGSCSRFDVNDTFALLSPGQYWLVVREDGNDATIANVDLVVEARAFNVCGNGVREGAEECDDGNTLSTDLCDSVCALQPYTAPSATATVTGSINPAGEIDRYEVIATTTVAITVETFTDASTGSCNDDTVIELVDSAGTQVADDDDGGVGACSLIFNQIIGPGTYFLLVNEFGNNGTIARYDVVFRSRVPPPLPPAPSATTPEQEPNDSVVDAQPLQISAGFGFVTIEASFAAGDLDFYSFEVPPGAPVQYRVVTHGTLNDFNTCTADTFLTLEDDAGNLIEFDDQGGFGDCSEMNGTLGPGVYYVLAEEFFGFSAPSYLLSVILN